jgi:serine/threonine protein kinase
MDAQELVDAALAALGMDAASPLRPGGQKLVYKGTFNGADAVAKIVILPPGPSALVALERAHREVELLAAVESNHVVKVLTDAIEIEDPPQAVCWVEEYLDGDDLTSLLTRKWGDDEVAVLLKDVAAGLAACHELEVVHRDLSPGNVRALTNGRFTVMDPGLARHLERTAITGVFQPGTLGFRSPEHVPGGEPIPASDVFGLGILAFYARTGTFPVDPTGPEAAYYRRLAEGQARPITDLEPGVADDIADIIDTCLQRQPARRYLDGHEVLKRMDAIMSEEGK